MRRLLGILREIVLLPVIAYRRWISPWTPATCRFSPTCSQYAIDAVRSHGIVKGGFWTLWRILRCHPFSQGGPDPVPPAPSIPQKRAQGRPKGHERGPSS